MSIHRFDDPGSFAVAALLGLLTGTFLVYSATTYDGIPNRSKLTKATGHVTWATITHKPTTLRFTLDDGGRTLQYSAISGNFDEARTAIEYGGFGEPLTVLYDANSPPRSRLGKKPTFEVYEISRAKTSIREWADVDAYQRGNKRTFAWIGAASIAGSGFLALHAFHLKRRSNGPS